MRKYCITIVLVLFCLIELRLALSAESTQTPILNVIFSEILLGTSNSGSEEFIELYNTTDTAVDLGGWRVEYFSATSVDITKPTRLINLSGELAAHSYILLSSTAYQTELQSIKYTATLSQAGGNLRLVHQDSDAAVLEDALGWGAGKLGLGDPLISPEAGLSVVRIQNEEDEYIPTANNIEDFKTTNILTPLDDNLLPEAEPQPPEDQTETSPDTEQASNEQTQPLEPKIYQTVYINEIFPNPAEPQSDAVDEFIELYNPHEFPVEISGYVLKAGLNGTYKHTFVDGDVIDPSDYIVVTSKNSNLTLSNTAGKVVLLSPDGLVLFESAEYADAPEGQAYISTSEGWQWTTTPTPATSNIYNAPPPPAVRSKAKKATAAKAKKAKTAKKTTTKAKAASAKKGNAQDKTVAIQDLTGPVHPLVLAGVGALTVVYAGYEYRSDFGNFVRKLRPNREYRTKPVKTTQSR